MYGCCFCLKLGFCAFNDEDNPLLGISITVLFQLIRHGSCNFLLITAHGLNSCQEQLLELNVHALFIFINFERVIGENLCLVISFPSSSMLLLC